MAMEKNLDDVPDLMNGRGRPRRQWESQGQNVTLEEGPLEPRRTLIHEPP